MQADLIASSVNDPCAFDETSGDAQDADQRLGKWFLALREPVRRWLSRHSKVPAAELDDLAQNVFVRLLRYSRDRIVENPGGYVLRIASNVASEWRERHRVAKPHESSWLDELLIDEAHEPENAVDDSLRQERLARAIEGLPERQRLVLKLTLEERLSYQAIAKQLSVTPRMVLRDRDRAYRSVRSATRGDKTPFGVWNR